jgi:pimeloyl-ACP methyl ester carboxylesterase
MQIMFRFIVLFLSALPLITASPIKEPRAVPPSLDPFYKPPEGFESKEPGTILRNRRVIASFFGLLPDFVETHQLLYRTTAIDGSPIATVTTVFKPLIAKRDRFVAFNTAYDAAATICNPSYNYQLGALQTDLISSVEYFIIKAYLLSGYTVASADYEGPDAAFSAGRLSGMGSLDGMRAVVNFRRKLGLSSNPMAVGAGYSGGAIATGWAASLQPTYAPELNVKGWVLGGTPANLTSVVNFVDGKLFAGFLPIAVSGLLMPSAYGAELQPIVDEIITPKGVNALELARTQCAVPNILAFAGQSILSYEFQSLGPELFNEPTVAAVVQDTLMAVNKTETPTAPLYLYHATEDEIIPYGQASDLRDRWCADGADVTFTTYAAGGHGTTEAIALPAAVKFVENAFDGKIGSGCTSKVELTDKLNPLALGLNLEPVLADLGEKLIALGKKDANFFNHMKENS